MVDLKDNWIVISKDMDGITGYIVAHSVDANDVRYGHYWSGCIRGLSMDRAEMQAIADDLNATNEPAPENIFRNVFTNGRI